MSRTLTVGTVNPGQYLQLPIYDSVIARQNAGPAVSGEIIFISDRRQVKIFDGSKWV